MTDKIREAFEAENGSTYEGDFAKYEDGEYVSELQQNNYLNFKAGYEAAQPKWLPIAEYQAEKHGDRVLVTGGVFQAVGGSGLWREATLIHMARKYKGDDYFTVNELFHIKPTHFMPLPPPPEVVTVYSSSSRTSVVLA